MRRPSLTNWLPRSLRRGESVASPAVRPELLCLEGRIVPATRTWIGFNNDQWSVPTNWAEGSVPVAGDDLVFTQAAPSKTISVSKNDLAANITFRSLTFQSGSFQLVGSAIALNNGGIVSDYDASAGPFTNVVDFPVVFKGTNQSIASLQTGNHIKFGTNARISLSDVDLKFDVAGGSNVTVGDSNAATFTDGIDGTGNIVKIGVGDLTFAAGNSYIGKTTVDVGTLNLSNTFGIFPGVAVPGDLVVGDGNAANGVALVNYTQADQIADTANVTVNLDAGITMNGKGDTIGVTDVSGTIDVGNGPLTVGDGVATTAITITGGTVTGSLGGGGILFLRGDMLTVASNNTATIGVAIDFQNQTRTITVGDGKADPDLILQGKITGATGFIKDGPGNLELRAQSLFNGSTTIKAGILSLNVPVPFGSVQSLPANMVLGDGVGGTKSAELRFLAARQVDNNNIGMSIQMGSDGYLNPNGFTQSIGALDGDGVVSISTGGTAPDLNVGFGNFGGTYNGTIEGEGRFVKVGTGTLTLNNDHVLDNAAKEGMVVQNGTLIVNGTLTGKGNGVLVGTGPGGAVAIYGGSGTVGAVTISGNNFGSGSSIDPGDALGGIGLIKVASLKANGQTMSFQIDGDVPGTGYDQVQSAALPVISATGSTFLNVSVPGSFVPPAGSGFVLVDNQTNNPITGKFIVATAFGNKTLNEGSFFTDVTGRFTFMITYLGGDGNDIEIIEASPPTAIFIPLSTNPSPDWPFRYELRFSAPVTDLTLNEIQFTGDGIGAGLMPLLTDNPAFPLGQSYFLDITGGPFEGTFGVLIPGGSVLSRANVVNFDISTTPADEATVDNIAPTVTVTTPGSPQTNQPSLPITITFSEVVFGFDQSQMQVSGGTVSNFVADADGKTFTFTLSRVVDSPFDVTIPAAAARDLVGNPNTPGTLTGAFDTVAPTATITLMSPSPTNTNPAVYELLFSEPILSTSLTSSDFTFNGTPLVGGSLVVLIDPPTGALYGVRVAGMSGSGVLRLNLSANSVVDLAGNTNLVGATANQDLIFDITPPTATVTATASAITNQPFVPVSVVFSEPVTGFTQFGIQAIGVTISNFVAAADNKTFTFRANRIEDSAFSVGIPAGVAFDLAGNPNTLSPVLNGLFDTVAPTVTITAPSGAFTNQSSVPITIMFSEQVVGFNQSMVFVSGGNLTNFTANPDGFTFTFTLTRITDGPFAVTVPAGVTTDVAGNLNLSGTISGAFDTTGPSGTITRVSASLISVAPAQFQVKFNEPLAIGSFVPSDITFTGSTVGGSLGATIIQESPSQFLVNVLGMSGAGTVRISIPAGAVTDVAGNPNPSTLVTSQPVNFDNIVPVPTITAQGSSFTTGTTVPIEITFTKPVTGFTINDIAIAGGTLSKFQSEGDQKTYTAVVNRITDGTFDVVIPSGVVTDAAGNKNTSSDTLAGSFDTTPPTGVLSTAAVFPTNASSVPISLKFSEPVTGFTYTGLNVQNGAVADFVRGADGMTFTFFVTRVADGEFSVSVRPGSARDLAGNATTGSAVLKGTFDTTGPTASITPNGAAFTVAPATFTVVFGETLVNPASFTASSVLLGGTAGPTSVTVTPAGDGRTFYLSVFGMTTTGTVTARVRAGAVTDLAGNPGIGSNEGSVRYVPPPGPSGPQPIVVGTGAGTVAEVKYLNADGTERLSLTPFPPTFTGGVRVGQADFNRDGVDDIIVGTGPGIVPFVTVYNGVNGAVMFDDRPFESSFSGGVYVSAGDLNSDGVPDLVISPDVGGGPRVIVIDGASFKRIVDFYAIEDPNFRGGVRTAIGDINGDGLNDLIAAAGFGGGPRVAIWDGNTLVNGRFNDRVVSDFFVFETALRNGAFVAAGDVNGDGFGDLIVGGGPGGAPRVRVLSGFGLINRTPDTVLSDFFSSDESVRGGVRVATRDVDGDGLADVITGDGTNNGSVARVFAGRSLRPNTVPEQILVLDEFPEFEGGIFVG